MGKGLVIRGVFCTVTDARPPATRLGWVTIFGTNEAVGACAGPARDEWPGDREHEHERAAHNSITATGGLFALRETPSLNRCTMDMRAPVALSRGSPTEADMTSHVPPSTVPPTRKSPVRARRGSVALLLSLMAALVAASACQPAWSEHRADTPTRSATPTASASTTSSPTASTAPASPSASVTTSTSTGVSAPRTASPYGIWGTKRPAGTAVQHGSPVTVGTQFHTGLRGTVSGVRFFRTGSDSAAHTARVWSQGGRVLRQVVLPARSTPGWQTAYFAHPLTVRSAESYVVGYSSDDGWYFQGRRTLTAAHTARHNALTATGGTLAGGNGFPRQADPGQHSMYVDVVYTPIAAADVARGFPNSTNTGVPSGTTLTPYNGPMTVKKAGTVIDGKTIDGDLVVEAKNVVVKNSMVNGDVRIDAGQSGASLLVEDTTVNAGRALGQDAYDGTGIGARNFTALRVNVYGGKRGINCFLDCTVRRSWIHDQARDSTGVAHESAVRMGKHSTIVDNTLLCNGPNVAPEAGCSADLTGYGDFAPVQYNLIEHNLFQATPSGGTCAYGGSSAGKPYSRDARGVKFVDNVFRRGHNRSDHGSYICGYYATVMDFDQSAPGNVFSGNIYDDGRRVPTP